MASSELEAYDSEEEFDISDASDGDFSVGERDSEGQIQPYMYEPSYSDDIEENMTFEVESSSDASTDGNSAGASSSRLNDLTW